MKIVDRIWGHVETATAILAMGVMTVSIFLQVIFRYIIQSALPWSEELARYAMIYLTFIGVSAGVKAGAHFAVTALVDALPGKPQKYLGALTHLVCAILFAALLALAADMVRSIYLTNQLTPAMQLPVYLVYLSLPLGFAGAVFRYAQITVQDVRTLLRADPEPGPRGGHGK